MLVKSSLPRKIHSVSALAASHAVCYVMFNSRQLLHTDHYRPTRARLSQLCEVTKRAHGNREPIPCHCRSIDQSGILVLPHAFLPPKSVITITIVLLL